MHVKTLFRSNFRFNIKKKKKIENEETVIRSWRKFSLRNKVIISRERIIALDRLPYSVYIRFEKKGGKLDFSWRGHPFFLASEKIEKREERAEKFFFFVFAIPSVERKKIEK